MTALLRLRCVGELSQWIGGLLSVLAVQIIALMSIYADLVCTRCNVRLWLGKVIHNDFEPIYYHIGPADQPPNWARDRLNAVLWKMLADHARHPLKVIVEGDVDYEPSEGTIELGDTKDLSFTDYLKNWPGHRRGDLPDAP